MKRDVSPNILDMKALSLNNYPESWLVGNFSIKSVSSSMLVGCIKQQEKSEQCF